MKLFIGKIILFFGIIYILQMLLISYFPPSLPEKVSIAKSYIRDTPYAIYFGDSILKDFNPSDADKRPIYDMLQDYFDDLTISPVEAKAYHSEVFFEYSQYFSENMHIPSVLIVPINMRTFSVEWDKRPEYQFERDKLYLRYAHSPIYPFLPFLIGFKTFNLTPIESDTFYDLPVVSSGKTIGTVREYEEDSVYQVLTPENFKKKLLYCYMYDLQSNHRKVQALRKIKDLAATKHIPVVFYFTPIDFQTGEKYLGTEFTRKVSENISVISDVLDDGDGTIIDLSFTLTTQDFNWSIYMNEHLKESGRKFVAEQIAKHISIN